jgi:Fic family protein
LIERQILPTPLLYLSAFSEASRRDYYDGLRGISERGAWNGRLEYFLLSSILSGREFCLSPINRQSLFEDSHSNRLR